MVKTTIAEQARFIKNLLKRLFFIFLMAFFLIFDDTTFAQNPELKIYDHSNSYLPEGRITAIKIDVAGNKWIGTSSFGLAKFDGIEWTIYDNFNSDIPDGDIEDVLIDSTGNIWLGSPKGLARFDGNYWTDYYNSYGAPNIWVKVLAIDRMNNVWIGTRNQGLVKFDGTKWTVYNTSNSELPDNCIFTIAIDDSGNKWIGTPRGLTKFDDINWIVYNKNNSGLPSNDIWKITIDGRGNKWIGSNDGLVKFDDINWKVFNTSNSGLPSNNISAIAVDAVGNKWIGTKGGGLAKFNGRDWSVYKSLNYGLLRNDFPIIVIDKSGNKWLGSSGSLIVYKEGGVSTVKKVKTKKSVEKNKVIYEDANFKLGSNNLRCGDKLSYAGKTYNTVKIGDQCWLKENLDVGIMIKVNANASNNSIIEKYCYANDTANCKMYGGLYQWDEAMQYSTTPGTKGICPVGWHIPTKTEFEELKASVAYSSNALKAIGQGTESGVGTNSSGFSALWAGFRFYDGYYLCTLGYGTYFWSSSEKKASSAYETLLYNHSFHIRCDYDTDKTNGYSIRCLKD